MEPGAYDFGGARFPLSSNTTIIGTAPGVNILAAFYIAKQSNIIVRNVQIKGAPCVTFDACRAGEDGVQIRESTNIWFDHVDVVDGQDGNFDVTVQGDYVTCSWCQFRYTTPKEHAFSNLIGGSDDMAKEVGTGDKLKVTYMYSWWGANVVERQPRGRYGKVHVFNSYYNSGRTDYVWGPSFGMQLLAENNMLDVGAGKVINLGFDEENTGVKASYLAQGNEGSGGGPLNGSLGTVFDPPYAYDLWPAASVKDKVTSAVCGAGNTCTLQR